MDERIEAAIKVVIGLITEKSTADEALKFSQAAVNLANAKRCLKD